MVAADVIADLIDGRDNPTAEILDARRILPTVGRTMVKNNAKSPSERFVGDRVAALHSSAPGPGVVVRRGSSLVTMACDMAGQTHMVGAACTHLGHRGVQRRRADLGLPVSQLHASPSTAKCRWPAHKHPAVEDSIAHCRRHRRTRRAGARGSRPPAGGACRPRVLDAPARTTHRSDTPPNLPSDVSLEGRSDDVQLPLYLCYEVRCATARHRAPRMEREADRHPPDVRAGVPRTALDEDIARSSAGRRPAPASPCAVSARIAELLSDGPSLSRYMETTGTLHPCPGQRDRAPLAYQLKEGDPQHRRRTSPSCNKSHSPCATSHLVSA